jgi:hypothetical protein
MMHYDEYHRKDLVLATGVIEGAIWSIKNWETTIFDTLDPIRLRRHLIKRVKSLGYEVMLAEREAA